MSGRESRSTSSDNSRRLRNKRRVSRKSRDTYSKHRDRSPDLYNRSSRRRSRSPNFEYARRRRDSSYVSRDNHRRDPLEKIIKRLDTLEERMPMQIASTSSTVLHQSSTPPLITTPAPVIISAAGVKTRCAGELTESSCDASVDAADRIVGALSSLIQVRSKHYYISNFDPHVHDFDQWCAEVDRGRELNHWDDGECLGRIGGCLRGEAKMWLNDWVTSDRTWSNFKTEFRSLCPRDVDMASILYDVMSTNSNRFTTYADYARKSLLRLNIVKGLTDELKVAIVVRGISDPQVKAATANAKLRSKDLVEFLSVYVKAKNLSVATNNLGRPPSDVSSRSHKREACNSKYDRLACFACGTIGHKQAHCPKKFHSNVPNAHSQKTAPSSMQSQSAKINYQPVKTCSFCKKNGHLVESCFTKERMESKSKGTPKNVNFCSELTPNEIT